MRLQKVIAQAGVTSRRKAEALIAQGRVSVNGHTVTKLGTTIDPASDNVVVDGRRLQLVVARQYILLHKPCGYVTTCDDDRGRPTVFERLPPEIALDKLFDGGRFVLARIR